VSDAPDLSWKRYGACHGKPPDWWYPVSETLVSDETLEAKALCEGCPVSQQCLTYALAHEDHGIWAGTSERERRRIRRKAGIAMASPSLSPQAVSPVPRHVADVDPFEETA
jgi:WhiB family redox-sensing transcriptional regulator